MCDCGCLTPVEDTYDDNSTYQPSTYDITGNPIDLPGYQAPVEVAPAPVAPVQVTPAPAPAGYDPSMSPTQALTNALSLAPAGSPEAAQLRAVIDSQNRMPGVWLQPSHDIYGNPL